MHKFILMVFTEDQRITMYTFWNIFFYKIKVEAKVYWIFLQQKMHWAMLNRRERFYSQQ